MMIEQDDPFAIPDFLNAKLAPRLTREEITELRRRSPDIKPARRALPSYGLPPGAPAPKIRAALEAAAEAELAAFRLAGGPPRPPRRT